MTSEGITVSLVTSSLLDVPSRCASESQIQRREALQITDARPIGMHQACRQPDGGSHLYSLPWPLRTFQTQQKATAQEKTLED